MNKIPNQFHFIFGLKPQNEPFHLAYYLCIESCFRVNNPEKIFFYYHYEPYGIYWEGIKDRLEIIKIDLPSFVRNDRYKDGLVKQFSYAHYADFIRLEKIIEHGGIYADIDTIFVKKIPEELFTYDFVIGKEQDFADTMTGEATPSLSNALFLARKDSFFAKKWLDEMYRHFEYSWSKHSCQLAHTLSRLYSEHIHVEPQRSFSCYDYTKEDIDTLFRKTDNNLDGIYSIHLLEHLWWSRFRRDFSNFHSGCISEINIKETDSTYNLLAKKYLPVISRKEKTAYLFINAPRHFIGFTNKCLETLRYFRDRLISKLKSFLKSADNCYTIENNRNSPAFSDKPQLLFLSPVVPSSNQNGLAMRAHHVITLLKKQYRIHLVVIAQNVRKNKVPSKPQTGLYETYTYINVACLAPISFLIKRFLLRHIVNTPLEWSLRSGACVKHISKLFVDTHFDRIHLFRLYLYPIAKKIHEYNPKSFMQVDIDDVEAVTRNEIAGLHKINKSRGNIIAQRAAEFYRKKEHELLHLFDTVFVCSEHDKCFLEREYALNKCEIIPNKIILSDGSDTTSKKENAEKNDYSILFVGALSYYPNAEGVVYFCTEILPRILLKSRREVTVIIVGKGLKKSDKKRLGAIPQVNITGYVDNLQKYYLDTDIVVAPLRAGGGTRIKILEAFSYCKPVVATSVGANGLEAEDGKHILIADSTEEFADKCMLLLKNKELRDRVTSNAFSLVKEKYSYVPIKKNT